MGGGKVTKEESLQEALVIEREGDGDWPLWALLWVSDILPHHPNTREMLRPYLNKLAAAQPAGRPKRLLPVWDERLVEVVTDLITDEDFIHSAVGARAVLAVIDEWMTA